MGRQRHLEQHIVGDDRRVEIDLEAFGVVLDVAIRGVAPAPAGIADTRPPDTFDDAELGVRRPESTNGERRGFEARGSEGVDRRLG